MINLRLRTQFPPANSESHRQPGCLLNCIFSFLCAFHPNCHTEGNRNNFQCFLGGAKKAMLPIFSSFLSQRNQGWAQKGDKQLGISRDFVNSPVGVREVAVYAADLRCPETAAMLWGRWLFSVTVRLWATGLQMKQGEEGCSLYRFKALLPYRACLLLWWGRGKKQQWINRQRAADNSVENTVAHFPAVCEFIRPHAVPLVISKSMHLIWCRCINSV